MMGGGKLEAHSGGLRHEQCDLSRRLRRRRARDPLLPRIPLGDDHAARRRSQPQDG
jgi:hypothetical protein